MENNRNEKIYISIGIIVLLICIFAIVYLIISSNNNISSNNFEDSLKSTNEDSSNSENLNEDYSDEMNVENPQNYANRTTVETEIATYTTTIYDKDENRVHNISLAISKLNGTVVKAGEEFSFNNTVGEMGESQGYKEALGFDTNGNKIKMLGGGICQISSTLYNSALIANLEITERHPHSRRVYYVPKDKDATIYYGSLDLKFKNNTSNDIKITATNDNVSVTVNLYKLSIE